MKKAIAIFLIPVILFYLGGYQLWYCSQESKSQYAVQNALDKDQYNNQELISITVPIENAYQNDWSEFRRVDGEIKFNGVYYTFVKEKVQDGKLILLCLPNHGKMKIEAEKNDLVKNIMGVQGNGKKTGSGKINIKPLIDIIGYCNLEKELKLPVSGSFTIKANNSNYSSTLHGSPEQPPEVVS